MTVEPGIFKAYDIRGIYPEQINEESAYALARAYATLIIKENPDRRLKIAVGADMRLSSPALKLRVIAGLLDSGIDVEDIGLVSTPTFYYAVAKFGYDGGLQVSASHNPKEYNGLKMVRRGAVPISKNTGIMEMKTIIETESFAALAEQSGELSKRENAVQSEAEDLSAGFDLSKIRPLRIAADSSNAMGALDLEALFAKLPQIELVKMNFELDGSFPVHEADPMKAENTAELCRKVVTEKCDLGIAPDGDGDRIFFIDERGEVLPQAILRGMMAQIELREHPGATVAYDIRPGRITKDMIEEFGGKAVVTPVGHSLIKEEMIKQGAIFGGESSGHYFYKLPYGTFEAPMLLILKLLKFISESGKPFSEIVAPFKRYAHSGEINTRVGNQAEAAAKIEQIKKLYQDGKQIFIDGVTVEYPDYWFNLRASNTEPLIRFTIEARSPEIMAAKRDEIMALLTQKVATA